MTIARHIDINRDEWVYVVESPRLRAIVHNDGSITLPDYSRLTPAEFGMVLALLNEIMHAQNEAV
jgi:hypothetical protein